MFSRKLRKVCGVYYDYNTNPTKQVKTIRSLYEVSWMFVCHGIKTLAHVTVTWETRDL